MGYTGYYLCRSNLSVAAPLMLDAFGPAGFTRQTLGTFLASPSAATHTQASTVALMLAAFCLLGPYSLLAGAIALDFGGRRGSATAASLIDTAGYLGAVLSGYLLGAIVESQGWPAVFLTLASVCFASVVVVWIYTREHATVAEPQRLSV